MAGLAVGPWARRDWVGLLAELLAVLNLNSVSEQAGVQQELLIPVTAGGFNI